MPYPLDQVLRTKSLLSRLPEGLASDLFFDVAQSLREFAWRSDLVSKRGLKQTSASSALRALVRDGWLEEGGTHDALNYRVSPKGRALLEELCALQNPTPICSPTTLSLATATQHFGAGSPSPGTMSVNDLRPMQPS